MTEMTDAYEWQGRELMGADGEKIGKVAEIYLDQETDRPEWATVTSGMFGNKTHFVPLAGATPQNGHVKVTATKEQVKAAPSVEPDGELSEQEEEKLFAHYGVPYTAEGSVTAQGAPSGERRRGTGEATVGRDTSGATTDDAMTRSEEELHVGTQRQEVGRARLRKHVVTEMVTRTVPVSHEEVTIEREPITDANRSAAHNGPEISDEEHEVVLHSEEPVVEKRTVAKERVRMGKETVSEDREVSEQVRKERIETEGTGNRR